MSSPLELLNHFELFGLQQPWLHLRGQTARPHELREPLFDKWVAHPLHSGFLPRLLATGITAAASAC